MRLVPVLAATLAGGCLARSLAVDTAVVPVEFEFVGGDFGCTPNAPPPLPEVRIRSHLQAAGAGEDDEQFDIVPCVAGSVVGGSTSPLELASYDLSLEVWDRFGGQIVARSPTPALVILTEPGVAPSVRIAIEPIP